MCLVTLYINYTVKPKYCKAQVRWGCSEGDAEIKIKHILSCFCTELCVCVCGFHSSTSEATADSETAGEVWWECVRSWSPVIHIRAGDSDNKWSIQVSFH